MIRTFRTLSLFLITAFLCFQSNTVSAAIKRVLFIGNSYVYTNDLPAIIANMALASGDTLITGASVPGGTTFRQHTTNATTLGLLAAGKWDYVVLQEQSQYPSFPDAQVAAEVYPFAKILDSLAHAGSPCSKTIFFMTWGRQNGDPQNCAGWPPVCTYQGMDSMLRLRYSIMAANNNAWISPVSNVWRRLLPQSATSQLFSPDGSHPSEMGSFAAACSFYSLFFGKSPALNSYNYTLVPSVATAIKTTAKETVFDSLAYWQRYATIPVATFSSTINNATVAFQNQSANAQKYFWKFGDGSTSTQASPQHTYTSNGNYTVCLSAIKNCDTIVACKNIAISSLGFREVGLSSISIYPNPATHNIYVQGITGKVKFILSDLSGRAMAKGELTASENVIKPIDGFAGICFLQIEDGFGNIRQLKIAVIR